MDIDLNLEKDRFFISVNKVGTHTFLMLGAYTDQSVSHLLCRVGKIVDADGQTNSFGCLSAAKELLAMFFSNVKAVIKDEGTERERLGETQITYYATDINFHQYLQFVRLLESLQTDLSKYECYKPIKQEGNLVTLRLTSDLMYPDKKKAPFSKSALSRISITNTCRHSAIKLVERIQRAPLSPKVSSNFLSKLLCKTRLDYGKPCSDQPFYVFPVPPAAYPRVIGKQRQVLEKIYKRMEKLLTIKPNEQTTQRKFQRLKELYLKVLGSQKTMPLREILRSIKQWRQENEPELKVLRKTYFWDKNKKRETATMKMVKQIEKDLSKSLGLN